MQSCGLEWFIPDPDPEPTLQVILDTGPGSGSSYYALKLGQESDCKIFGYITGLWQDIKSNFKIF
jgi:hypothetical protein